MRQFVALMKKEWMELWRTGKLLVLMIVFFMFGIMNPAIAKLTPLLYEAMGDSLKEQGITISEVNVTALTSWEQFYKNVSMMLIFVIIMFAGILVNECSNGTLVLLLTKGLKRWKVIATKVIISVLVWTICYWMSFGVTYGYNEWYWDNSIARHILFSAMCIYLFGVWLLSVIIAVSAVCKAMFQVLLLTGGIFAGSYIAQIIPKVGKYLPTNLSGAGELLKVNEVPDMYVKCIAVVCLLVIVNIAMAVLFFNKRTD